MKRFNMFKKKLIMLFGCVYAISSVWMVTSPVYATEVVTEVPTEAPTEVPTEAPTEIPTEAPTEAPTEVPTEAPTEAPTVAPTEAPTEAPTVAPTEAPTVAPTQAPTVAPTVAPTEAPTVAPTQAPTVQPTTAAPVFVPTGIDAISVDGDMSEWKGMTGIAAADGSVSEWKVTKSEDGTMIYLCYTGTATTEWDSHYIWDMLDISYADGSSMTLQFGTLADAWILPGASVAYSCSANGNNPGTYVVECALPIARDDYMITFAGTTITAAEIPGFVPAQAVEPVYNGIVVDGIYDDWDAVAKAEAACPAEAGHAYDCLDYAACVFDGDYVYLYLQDGVDGSAAGAGMNSNGRYSITTDTGRQLVFQLSADNGGTVNGVEGATAAYFGNEWEVAIPISALPLWKESISFGLYQSEPFVSGVMNLQGVTGPGESGSSGTAGEFNGIVYDGLYGDWNAYPHTLIQYATAGTQTNNPDGEGALYTDGSIVYGHVISSMDAHLADMGGEFASAISICFNGDYGHYGDKSWNLFPRLVAVSADGTINWSPQTSQLAPGNYEFYIADIRGEYNTQTQQNISDLADYEQFFGKITITVGEKVDECEFYIDLEQVAKFLSHYSGTTIDASDFKLIEAQFGLIGQNWLTIGGTSSGPVMGVAMCMAVSGLVLLKRRRKDEVIKE